MTIRFNCYPGQVGSRTLSVLHGQPTQDYATNVYKTEDMELVSNASRNARIVWPIDKFSLEQWTAREDGSANASIDGRSHNVSVRETDNAVEVVVGTNYSNSSLSQGTYTAELSYYYLTRSEAPVRPDPDADRVSVEAETASVTVGDTVSGWFTVDNPNPNRENVRVEPRISVYPECEYVEIASGVDADQYRTTTVYELPRNSTTDIEYRVDLTDVDSMEELDLVDSQIRCEYVVSGPVEVDESFIIRVDVEDRITVSAVEWIRSHPVTAAAGVFLVLVLVSVVWLRRL